MPQNDKVPSCGQGFKTLRPGGCSGLGYTLGAFNTQKSNRLNTILVNICILYLYIVYILYIYWVVISIPKFKICKNFYWSLSLNTFLEHLCRNYVLVLFIAGTTWTTLPKTDGLLNVGCRKGIWWWFGCSFPGLSFEIEFVCSRNKVFATLMEQEQSVILTSSITVTFLWVNYRDVRRFHPKRYFSNGIFKENPYEFRLLKSH